MTVQRSATPQPPGAARTRRGAAPRTRAHGLDGVRALAVLAVMAFHEGLGATPGGFLGVDVFFVLSGYLITDLLVSRHDRSGRLDLRGFWTRRARRLLPALAVVLVTVTAGVALIEPGQLPALRPALAAAVTYSSNWYQALNHVSYFASFGPPPPLEHLWSLAIEEQFYLAWPLILALALTQLRTRRARARVAWAGAIASAVAMAVLYLPSDPSRVYYGTDTHASALLIGAAVALTWPLATLTAASRGLAKRLDFLGILSLLVLAWAVGHFSGSDPAVYPVGLVIAALAAAGLTAAAAAPGVVSAMLSLRPLRWLGIRSYGIYLWHWPVIALAAAVTGPGPTAAWLWIAEPAVAITLAAASWRWIESPILRDGVTATCRTWYRTVLRAVTSRGQSPVRLLPAVAAMGALCVAGTAGYGVLRPAGASGLQRQVALGERVSAASRAHATPAVTPSATHSPAPTASTPAARPAPASGTRGALGPEVTAVGDSVMLASAPQLAAALPGIYIDAEVSRQMSGGLAVVASLASKGKLRHVVVVGLGTNGTVTSGQIRDLLAILGPRRKLVLVNTYEARPWEHEVNQVLAAAAHRYPGVVLANWHATISGHTDLLWPDQVHPRPSGAELYARMVAAAVASTLPPPATPPVPVARPPLAGHRLLTAAGAAG